MSFNIQKIQENDFEALISLFKEFALFEKLPEKMTNSVEKMKQEQEFFHGFTAKGENGEIVAYATFFFAYYTWTGKSLYMDDLYVKEDFRGKGVGSKLIKEVISFAKEQNCNGMRWQVSEWNDPAIAFYKNLGATINPIERNCDLIF